MTTTTPNTPNRTRFNRRGFSLAETVIAMTLSIFVMGGVMSTFLYLTRTGYNMTNYTEMEAQSRKGLELFARDVRMAKDLTWNSTTNITLVVPTSGSDVTYVYNYDAAAGAFTKTDSSTATTTTLISGITPSSFALQGYKITTDPTTHYPYAVDLTQLGQASTDTKQLQLTLSVGRSRATLASNTGNVISARFILRNKKVTS